MANATVRASSGAGDLNTGNPATVTFPGTPQVGDPIGIWITGNDNAITFTTPPTGWTLGYGAAIGTGLRVFIWKLYASGDGAAVSLTFSAAPTYAQAVVVFDGSVHSGFGTIGTVTTRASSITTTTAALTGSTSNPNIVVSHEKASTHTSAPTLSPATTSIQNITTVTASSGSVYVGSYDTSGGTAARTLTYSTASANGAAYQIPMNLAAARRPRPPAIVRTAVARASTY